MCIIQLNTGLQVVLFIHNCHVESRVLEVGGERQQNKQKLHPNYLLLHQCCLGGAVQSAPGVKNVLVTS